MFWHVLHLIKRIWNAIAFCILDAPNQHLNSSYVVCLPKQQSENVRQRIEPQPELVHACCWSSGSLGHVCFACIRAPRANVCTPCLTVTKQTLHMIEPKLTHNWWHCREGSLSKCLCYWTNALLTEYNIEPMFRACVESHSLIQEHDKRILAKLGYTKLKFSSLTSLHF